MFDDFLKKSAELMSRGQPFVVATVVRALAPTSGKPGDKAIVQPDGAIWGWIGGGCAQPVVIKEALKALAEGHPRLVRISPSPDAAEEGIVDYTMTCHSGGSLDIYIEPVIPRTQIVVLGRSPIAKDLVQLAGIMGYATTVVVSSEHADEFPDTNKISNLRELKANQDTFIVVSTQGEDDEGALEQAVASGTPYVAFVASKTKAEKVMLYLRGQGIAEEALKKVRAPAGLDLGAKTSGEIAVSILAEIIQVHAHVSKAPVKAALSVLNTSARDPVCGMTVDAAKSKYRSEYNGSSFYFCCGGCKQAFDLAPAKYLASADR